MKKVFFLMAFVFSCVLVFTCYGNAQDFKLGEIYQLTSDELNSGWGIFTPDDEGIVYFTMKDYDKDSTSDTKINRLGINDEKLEEIAYLKELETKPFMAFPKPQWKDSKNGIFSFYYDDSDFGHASYVQLLEVDMFGQAKKNSFYEMCSTLTGNGPVTSWGHGPIFSPNENNIAIFCVSSTGNVNNAKSTIFILPTNELFSDPPGQIDASDIISVPVEGVVTDLNYLLDDWSANNEIVVSEYPNAEASGFEYEFTHWVSRNAADSKLFKIDSTGNKKYIAKHACCGSYSPDGEHIVFIDTGDGQVWIMNKDGEEKKALTEGENRKFMPSFSKDGTSITWTELKSLEQGEAMFGQKKGEGTSRFVIMFSNFVDEEE